MAVALASTVSSETEGGQAGILTGPSIKRLPKPKRRRIRHQTREEVRSKAKKKKKKLW
jgi:hypothetical protein